MPGRTDTLLEVLTRPVLEVAPRLLNAVFRHDGVAVRITEVEAYDGTNDPGSHAFRGPTPRNQVMFGPPGHLYTYFTYGMHHCANVVCGPQGTAAAVLLRAGEVVAGIETARERRGAGPDRDLARGPARLCSALALDLSHNGLDLTGGALMPGPPVDSAAISTGPRVGLRQAPDHPWRFWLTDDPTVSRYVPAKPVRKRVRTGDKPN
jgi:DNA-3-methyladenine glycosylase